MGKLIVNNDKISDKREFIKVCPFGALEFDGKNVSINPGCKMCRLCVKKSTNGEVVFVEDVVKKPSVDKSLWSGIAVYADTSGDENGGIHPVTYELISKARELADKPGGGGKVYCLLMGENTVKSAQELSRHYADEIYVYDSPSLTYFRTEPYTSVIGDFIMRVKPSAMLFGATPIGRQLAPRVAARFRTGLTADCTILDIEPNSDLSQIRPAFGGNIMAHIFTPNNRPQLATVRYKIMQSLPLRETEYGKIIRCDIDESKLFSGIEVLSVERKPRVKSIEHAEVLVAVGRGVKTKEDLPLFERLAELLGGELGCTRPLVEAGWFDGTKQIGLSGRTVRPRLIITCGVSGAVQFAAGMNSSDCIIAINKDIKAPIFKTAHYGVVGDIYEIVPMIIKELQGGGND